MRDTPLLLAFNRGRISNQALARLDLKRTALSSEIQSNWMPLTLGPMMLRPGLQYLLTAPGPTIYVPFIFSSSDTALVELSTSGMRVLLSESPISRPAVTTTLANGTFTTDLASWTDSDQAACTSAWATGGYMSLLGTGDNAARRDQLITVAGGNVSVEHGLAVQVNSGTLLLSAGTTLGGTNYIDQMSLGPGDHNIALTPTGDFYIRLEATTTYPTLVDSIAIASTGEVVLPIPWGETDLPNIRWEQSGDILFLCDGAHPQYRIERQAARSWSVVKYRANDGPFRNQNYTPTTMTASALIGACTLTASKATFKAGHVGALFRLSSNGQKVAHTVTGETQWTDYIRVTGVSASRAFTITVYNQTGTSTVSLQRSVGAPGDWAFVSTQSVGTRSYNDTLDNQIVYYRIGVDTGDWTSGTVTVALDYPAGSIDGVCRITSLVSDTVANISVLKSFGGTDATLNWYEGRWSDYRGWPSAVALYDGRLWWAGNDKIDGSVSDAYASFDDSVEGDAGPISRSIGRGPVDTINWILPVSQLLFGTQSSELTAKASSLDEPLTPTAFSLKPLSTQGSARVPAAVVDTSGVFVQRNGFRVLETALDSSAYAYSTNDLTSIIPEIGEPGIIRLGVQRQPDTRIHCVRADGSIALLVYDRAENVNCWVDVTTDGFVEDVVVLPGAEEDTVYYLVSRTINGTARRYLEKFALASEARGAVVTKLADSSLNFDGPLTTVTGLDHLEGATVVVWGNAKDLGTYTVSSGAITLSEAAEYINVGLPYIAKFKGSKLVVNSPQGSAGLTNPREITHVGLLLSHTHAQGIQYGQDFDHLDDLPLIEMGASVDGNTIWTDYEQDSVELNGTWDRDARLCLTAASPRPCTVIAAVIDLAGHAK